MMLKIKRIAVLDSKAIAWVSTWKNRSLWLSSVRGVQILYFFSKIGLKFHTHTPYLISILHADIIAVWWCRLPRQVVAARYCLPAAVHGYHTCSNITVTLSFSFLFFASLDHHFFCTYCCYYITSLHTRWMPRARRRPRSSKLNFNKKQRPRQMPPPSRSGKRLKMTKSKKVPK